MGLPSGQWDCLVGKRCQTVDSQSRAVNKQLLPVLSPAACSSVQPLSSLSVYTCCYQQQLKLHSQVLQQLLFNELFHGAAQGHDSVHLQQQTCVMPACQKHFKQLVQSTGSGKKNQIQNIIHNVNA
ncbi:TPA: hypothetical protein ACH3X1_016803 [Trebouxia sp. C0004]